MHLALSQYSLQLAPSLATGWEVRMQRHEHRQVNYAIKKANRIGFSALAFIAFAHLIAGLIH
jgi:hypothetical protein